MKVQLLGRSAGATCLNYYLAHPTVICQQIYGLADVVGGGEALPALAVQIACSEKLHKSP